MDKCLTTSRFIKGSKYDKNDIFEIIKEFSSNLLSSYDLSEREIAQSLAKACKKQITYRFRLPNLSGLVSSLHSKNEELNIVKLAEVGTGRRGTIYEFTYPYCILMDIDGNKIDLKPIPKFSTHIHWNSSSTPNHIQGSVSPYMLATPSFNS